MLWPSASKESEFRSIKKNVERILRSSVDTYPIVRENIHRVSVLNDFFAQIPEWLAAHDASIIDQNIDVANLVFDYFGRSNHILTVRNVDDIAFAR